MESLNPKNGKIGLEGALNAINKKHAILNSELRVAITLHQQTKNQIMFLLSKLT